MWDVYICFEGRRALLTRIDMQLSIGTMIGALLAGPLADRIGRKWSIFAWCMILHVGLIIQISSPSGKWYQMMMGRFVTGFGVGACSLLVPMYQGEIAPRHIRGAMVWYVNLPPICRRNKERILMLCLVHTNSSSRWASSSRIASILAQNISPTPHHGGSHSVSRSSGV